MSTEMNNGDMRVISRKKLSNWQHSKEILKLKKDLEEHSKTEELTLKYFGQLSMLLQLSGASFCSCNSFHLDSSGSLQR